VDKSSEIFHNLVRLSTISVDKSSKLWINAAVTGEFRLFVAFETIDACG
jgi:hypothetical protein